jgi:uncharacterized protein (TIGR00304 family)
MLSGDTQLADFTALYPLGFALIFIGILLVIVATVLMSSSRSDKRTANASGAIIIGPIPIIFGSDQKSVKSTLLLSVTLTTLLIVAMVVYYFLLR